MHLELSRHKSPDARTNKTASPTTGYGQNPPPYPRWAPNLDAFRPGLVNQTTANFRMANSLNIRQRECMPENSAVEFTQLFEFNPNRARPFVQPMFHGVP